LILDFGQQDKVQSSWARRQWILEFDTPCRQWYIEINGELLKINQFTAAD